MLMVEGLNPNDTVLEQHIPRKEVLFEHTVEVCTAHLLFLFVCCFSLSIVSQVTCICGILRG